MFRDGKVTVCNPINEVDLATYLIKSCHDESKFERIINLGGLNELLTMKKQGGLS